MNVPQHNNETELKLNILHHTEDFRGDHSADVAIAIEPKTNETVADLVRRVDPSLTDRIEIRLVVED